MFALYRMYLRRIRACFNAAHASGARIAFRTTRPSASLAVVLPLLLSNRVMTATTPSLIPYPHEVQMSGGTLILPRTLSILVDDEEDRFAAITLCEELSHIDGIRASTRSNGNNAQIVLARESSPEGQQILHAAGLTLPNVAREEGYTLVVDRQRVAVVAASSAGVFYGAQTLRQQQVVAHHRLEHRRLGPGQAHAGPDGGDQLHAHLGVAGGRL